MWINIQNRIQVLFKTINLESSNTSVVNKLYESPIPMHLRSKDNDKEKTEKDKLNNFKQAYHKKYSISPTLQVKRDQNGNNNEIGEFKLELRSIFKFFSHIANKLNLIWDKSKLLK